MRGKKDKKGKPYSRLKKNAGAQKAAQSAAKARHRNFPTQEKTKN